MWPTLRSTAAAKSCSGEAIRKLSGLPATQTKLAILFPGQGAQKAGMGADLLEAFPYTKHVADSIDQALGYFLSRRMVNHEESLVDTRLTQPAMLLHSAMLLEVLQKELDFEVSSDGECPVVAALGHSVGEISALSAAGCLSPMQAASFLSTRGSAMANANHVSDSPTGMSALLPTTPAAVRAAAFRASADCRNSSQPGVAVAANLNSATQTVISGHQHVIDAVVASLKTTGRLRAVKLAVSAPFHSPVLLPAVPEIMRAIAPGRRLLDAALPPALLGAAFCHDAWYADFQAQHDSTISLRQLCSFMGSYFQVGSCKMDEQDDIEDDPALASLLRRGAVPVFSNVTAQPHSFGGDDAALALALQAIAPVQWHTTMQNVLQVAAEADYMPPNVLLEVGPGNTLTSLAKQIAKEKGQGSTDDPVLCNLDSAKSIASLVRRAEKSAIGLGDVQVWQAGAQQK